MLRNRLRTFDQWVRQMPTELVVTHGELAPPERDLRWFARIDTPALQRYARQAGRAIQPALLGLFRLRWPLDDAACCTHRLRTATPRSADTEHAWRALQITCGMLERCR